MHGYISTNLCLCATLRQYPISGTASRVNPEEKSGAGVAGLRHFVIDFSIVLATHVTALVLDYMGSCPSLWITPGTPKGGTSVTWRGGTHCMDNSLSSISPLPRHAPWRGPSSAVAKRQHSTRSALLQCQLIVTFEGADPWPLVTDGCH